MSRGLQLRASAGVGDIFALLHCFYDDATHLERAPDSYLERFLSSFCTFRHRYCKAVQ